jgi:alpha 1,2-mannosyltransferase
MEENPQYVVDHESEDSLWKFVTEDNGDSYNGCHFWSNFEIGSIKFLRSQAYLDYFNYLDREGGFFYERWGDAPVHSLGVAMFLKKSEVHFFNDIGYRHEPFMHCPPSLQVNRKCHCDPGQNFGKAWSTDCCNVLTHLLKIWKDSAAQPAGLMC